MRQTRALLPISLVLVLGACGAEETDPPTDTSEDGTDTDGGDVDTDATDVSGDPDGTVDAAVDAPVDVPVDVPTDGSGDPDASDVTDTDVAPDAADGSGDTASDVPTDLPDIEDCLAGCGVGCPAPEFQPCASDGNFYCNTCIIGCYGLDVLDPVSCAPGEVCAAPADAPAIETVEYTGNELCVLPYPDFGSGALTVVMTTEEEFQAVVPCEEEGLSGINWNVHRLVRAVFSENPAATLRGVVEEEGSGVGVYLSAPRYCGGAPPPDTSVWLLVPAGDGEVRVETCGYGTCEGPPRP